MDPLISTSEARMFLVFGRISDMLVCGWGVLVVGCFLMLGRCAAHVSRSDAHLSQ
jgi:hypothetical protein